MSPGAKEVGVEIFSLSKSYSMLGWRVGFVVGNRKIGLCLKKNKKLFYQEKNEYPYTGSSPGR
ncbi:hypothetical protein DRJ04_08135 [Candidatus Aerophobetes bacterium]|uniref:Aminotransferase n=1 Tax=Aerophobetes bacterium TaxID=2030807 RepID=A0A662DBK7_UNCAE|nr:MAG: hypothetical protein DRJ04_08135 [Candidatus Aerophobetes bacterium]